MKVSERDMKKINYLIKYSHNFFDSKGEITSFPDLFKKFLSEFRVNQDKYYDVKIYKKDIVTFLETFHDEYIEHINELDLYDFICIHVKKTNLNDELWCHKNINFDKYYSPISNYLFDNYMGRMDEFVKKYEIDINKCYKLFSFIMNSYKRDISWINETIDCELYKGHLYKIKNKETIQKLSKFIPSKYFDISENLEFKELINSSDVSNDSFVNFFKTKFNPKIHLFDEETITSLNWNLKSIYQRHIYLLFDPDNFSEVLYGIFDNSYYGDAQKKINKFLNVVKDRFNYNGLAPDHMYKKSIINEWFDKDKFDYNSHAELLFRRIKSVCKRDYDTDVKDIINTKFIKLYFYNDSGTLQANMLYLQEFDWMERWFTPEDFDWNDEENVKILFRSGYEKFEYWFRPDLFNWKRDFTLICQHNIEFEKWWNPEKFVYDDANISDLTIKYGKYYKIWRSDKLKGHYTLHHSINHLKTHFKEWWNENDEYKVYTENAIRCHTKYFPIWYKSNSVEFNYSSIVAFCKYGKEYFDIWFKDAFNAIGKKEYFHEALIDYCYDIKEKWAEKIFESLNDTLKTKLLINIINNENFKFETLFQYFPENPKMINYLHRYFPESIQEDIENAHTLKSIGI